MVAGSLDGCPGAHPASLPGKSLPTLPAACEAGRQRDKGGHRGLSALKEPVISEGISLQWWHLAQGGQPGESLAAQVSQGESRNNILRMRPLPCPGYNDQENHKNHENENSKISILHSLKKKKIK